MVDGQRRGRSGLTAELEALRAVGLGGVEITPIYGVSGAEASFVPYLSDRWVGLLEHTLREARRLDLGVDMATGTGWPFGGPWIGERDASRALTYRTWTVEGGQRLTERVRVDQTAFVRAIGNQIYEVLEVGPGESPPAGHEAGAVDPRRSGSRIQITDLEEPVEANADLQAARARAGAVPEAAAATGARRLLRRRRDRRSHESCCERRRARMGRAAGNLDDLRRVPRLARQARRARRAWWRRQRHRSFFSRRHSAPISDDSTSPSPDAASTGCVRSSTTPTKWMTPTGRRTERSRCSTNSSGVAAMTCAGICRPCSARTPVRLARGMAADYRLTIADLLHDDFTEPWRAWARRRGAIVRNQAHGSPGNLLDLYAASDIPETEGTEIPRFKWATSAAHVAGRRLIAAEAATWLGEHFRSTLADVRAAIDRFFVAGVNHIVYHGTAYSPPQEPWPGWQFYASVEFNPRNSWWADFAALNQYVTRVQSFLQSGTPDHDVLVYYPFYDALARAGGPRLAHFGTANSPPKGPRSKPPGRLLERRGFTYDFISDRQLCIAAGLFRNAGDERRRIVQDARRAGEPVRPAGNLRANPRARARRRRGSRVQGPGRGCRRVRQPERAARTAPNAEGCCPFGRPDADGIRAAQFGRGTVLLR